MVDVAPRLLLYYLAQIYGEAHIIFDSDIAAFFPAYGNYLEVYLLKPDLEVIRPLQVLFLRLSNGAILPL